jgi:hypothetical protein
MCERLDEQLRFLSAAGVESMAHSERGLLDHLQGTRDLLIAWGARDALCLAGLFHSVYGTEHYVPAAIPVSMREELRGLIGEEAERLAWIFCVMKRETFDENLTRESDWRVQHRITGDWISLTGEQFGDLVTLTFANTLEAMPRLSWGLRRACRAYLRPFRSVAMSRAQTAFDKFEIPWWNFWNSSTSFDNDPTENRRRESKL